MKRNWYHIKCFLLGIATSFSLLAPLDIKYVIPRTMYDNDNFAMFILGLFFFWFYDKFFNKRKKNYAFQFLAILFSIFLIFREF